MAQPGVCDSMCCPMAAQLLGLLPSALQHIISGRCAMCSLVFYVLLYFVVWYGVVRYVFLRYHCVTKFGIVWCGTVWYVLMVWL